MRNQVSRFKLPRLRLAPGRILRRGSRISLRPIFIFAIILAATLNLSFAPVSTYAKTLSQMTPTEQAKSWLYYNAMLACVENGSITGSAWNNTTSPSGISSGKWFNSGAVNPGIGYPLGAMGVTVNGFPSSSTADKVECGGDNIAWINDAFKLWGYADNQEAWCSVTGNLNRSDGAICAGSSSSSGWKANEATTAIRENFANTIKQRVYAGAAPSRSDAARYIHAQAAFYGGCLQTASPTPYTGSQRGDTVFTDVKVVSVDAQDETKINNTPTMYAGVKKKSDSIWYSITANKNNVTETCQGLVNQMNQYAAAYATTLKERINNGESPDSTNGDAAGTGGEESTSCAIPGVGWIVCPTVNFLASIADSAFGFLSDNFLSVNTDLLEVGGGTNIAWSTMRTIANIAFVIAFLVIIFSQLTGQGIANYGIKKMLPRLVIAALLVNISFFICQIAVDLSNILGVSLKSVFDGIGDGLNLYNPATEPNRWESIAGLVLVGGAAAAGAWALGASVLIPALIGAVIALIMIFFILIVRQVAIILLVVIAPLAFVAFLFPNTQQLFTRWRKMFTTLLLVFPIIGLVFGASSLASTILQGVYGEDSNQIGQIIAAAVLVLPLFLLPVLLKTSLNALGTVGAKINGIGDKIGRGARSKTAGSGVLKSLSNRRQRTRAQVGAGIYSGRNPVSKIRSGLNSRLNKNERFNQLTGDYGTIRGANIDRLEGEETKLAESAVELQERSGVSAESQLQAAVASGNITRAIAAQNILMRKGGPGVNSVRGVLSGEMSSEMRGTLASNIMQNHAQAAKQKSNDVLQWAVAGGARSMAEVSGTSATWGSLTASELANQTDAAFESALNSGGVSAVTIEALKSERMRGDVNDKKRAAIAAFEHGRSSSTVPASNSTVTGATGASSSATTPAGPQSTPSPITNTESATQPGMFRPESRELTREQIQNMGVDNAQKFAESRGYDNLHDGDVLTISNVHRGTEVGERARQEVINRGLVDPPTARDPNTMPKQ